MVLHNYIILHNIISYYIILYYIILQTTYNVLQNIIIFRYCKYLFAQCDALVLPNNTIKMKEFRVNLADPGNTLKCYLNRAQVPNESRREVCVRECACV